MKISNMKIGMRLGLSFGLVLTLMIVLALLGALRMSQIEDSLDGIVNNNNVQIKSIFEMRQSVLSIGMATRNLALMTDEEQKERENDRIFDDRDEYASYVENLDRLVTSEEGKKVLAKIAAMKQATDPLTDKVIELLNDGKQEDAVKVLVNEVQPSQRKWLGALDEMVRLLERQADQAVTTAQASYKNALIWTLGISLAAVLLGVGTAWRVTRGITRPINEAVRVARRVAEGDLSGRIEVQSSNETGQLMQALKDMNESLQRIVTQVRSGTETIAAASTQIASGNQDLSSRTEQQASSLQETASSMEELSSTVRQNADNARQANMLAQTASEVAVKGGAVVSKVVETMGSIDGSAKKIAQITSVIDGIAFQTNILALNAAVEAARAGEQGRGFAVVAAEVRGLAQRSATAAKEIKALIDDSVEKVTAGSKLVDEAGSTMQEVVASVRRVTDIMDEIASSSLEQNSGIEQISNAVARIDEVTHQNAALVEEAAAAAEELHKQADSLAEMVTVFRLEGDEAANSDFSAEQLAEQVGAQATGTPAAAQRALAAPSASNTLTPAVKAGRTKASVPAKPSPREHVAQTSRTGTDDWEEF